MLAVVYRHVEAQLAGTDACRSDVNGSRIVGLSVDSAGAVGAETAIIGEGNGSV